MIDKRPNLDEAFFPVELRDLFTKSLTDNGFREEKVRSYKAVVAIDDHHVFSVVSSNYRLVTNKEAHDLGAICYQTVFKVNSAKDLELFNIIMPRTRSFCHLATFLTLIFT